MIRTAMIVDDDNDINEMLATMLESRNMLAMSVRTLQEAEDCLAVMKPTVIFLDNSFPEGLGINFIKNIHEVDSEIKIVMMTADSAKWIEEKAISEGIDYFLRKPFSLRMIDEIVYSLKR